MQHRRLAPVLRPILRIS